MIRSARDCRAVGDVVVPDSRPMVAAALYMLSMEYFNFSYVMCRWLILVAKILITLSKTHTLIRLPENGPSHDDVFEEKNNFNRPGTQSL